MRQIVLIFTAILCCEANLAQARVDSLNRDGHLYVKVEDSSNIRLDTPDKVLPLFDNVKLNYEIDSVWRPFPGLNNKLNRTYQLTFDKRYAAQNVITSLENIAYIQYAERVPLHYKHGIQPNDYQSEQYHLDLIDAQSAWEKSKGSDQVIIAIVDNAVLIDHEDLANNLWTNEDEIPGNDFDDDLNTYVDDVHGYDVADDNGDPTPPPNPGASFSHGTHVAGIASAKTNNGKGIASLGYKCNIMSVKCSPDSSDGEVLYNAYDGVYYAIRNGADVINMSWGGPNMTVTGQNIFQTADNRDIVCIASAGNANTNEKYYPAAYETVMAIGATTSNDKKANYSNYGSWISVMAPGSNIYSLMATSKSDYGRMYGTSMSAPLVSGLAGLLKTQDTGISDEKVNTLIKEGAVDISNKNSNYSGQLGAGRINAYNTLAGATSRAPQSKTVELNLFPNPAHKQIHFDLKGAMEKPFDLTLYNMHGKTLLKRNSFIKEWNDKQKLNVNELKPGIYMAQLRNASHLFLKKIIITDPE